MVDSSRFSPCCHRMLGESKGSPVRSTCIRDSALQFIHLIINPCVIVYPIKSFQRQHRIIRTSIKTRAQKQPCYKRPVPRMHVVNMDRA